MPFRLPARALVVLALCLGCRSAPPDDTIAPNDNQRPAGTRKGNVLTVHLEARTGHWQPDGTGGVVIDSIGAFGEVGGPLSTPGPLIRVPVGTNVRGTVRNALGHAVTVYGLGKARGASDSTVLAAGASAPFEFTAATPGTYFYHATRGIDPLTGSRPPEEMQLHGAIIVDAPNAPPDRILAMSWHYVVDTTMPTGVRKPTMTINGLSWPHTEHLTYAQGDSIRWRVINFTEFEHPMHLHGFYFRVTSQSDEAVDTLYTNEQQRMVATEMLGGMRAIQLEWKAERPGNWIFHCHYAVHVGPLVDLDARGATMDPNAHARHESAQPHHMSGLVTGLTITPKGDQPTPARSTATSASSNARSPGSTASSPACRTSSPIPRRSATPRRCRFRGRRWSSSAASASPSTS